MLALAPTDSCARTGCPCTEPLLRDEDREAHRKGFRWELRSAACREFWLCARCVMDDELGREVGQPCWYEGGDNAD